MTVLHETPECDRQRNALRAERLARMSPKPKPVIVAIVAPEPVPAKVKCVNIVPVPLEAKEKEYLKSSTVSDHGRKNEEPVPVPSLTHIKTMVGRRYRVSVLDMESDRRTADIVRPRQIATYLCATMTRRSLPAIGRAFGGRDHTTGLHSKRKIAALRAADPVFDADVEALKQSILETFMPDKQSSDQELGVQSRSSTPPLTDGTRDAGTEAQVPPPTNLPHNKTRSEHSGTSA